MERKLTLKLDQELIRKAKAYAKEQKVSLSSLIEAYLETLTSEGGAASEITSLAESLSRVLDSQQAINFKEEHTDYLVDKYK